MIGYAKAVNAQTRELRMLRVNGAVRAMLVRHDTHWAKRSNGRGGSIKLDVLLITSDALWERLLPYFTYELEKTGRKHKAHEVTE